MQYNADFFASFVNQNYPWILLIEPNSDYCGSKVSLDTFDFVIIVFLILPY